MKNNKGFSLVELIIVIAILAVVTGGSIVGFGYLYRTDVKSTVKKIDSSLLKTQSYTTSKSTGGRDVKMILKTDGSGNYCIGYEGIEGQEDVKIGKSRLAIKCYKTDGTQVTVGSNQVKICFDRATGGLLPVDENDPNGVCWSKIEVSAGGTRTCTITISKVTGKTEVTYFQ